MTTPSQAYHKTVKQVRKRGNSSGRGSENMMASISDKNESYATERDRTGRSSQAIKQQMAQLQNQNENISRALIQIGMMLGENNQNRLLDILNPNISPRGSERYQ